MPQRFLRPGLTTSKRWNSLSWISQSFYVRLLTLVDDFGRYDAAPRLLRSHVFPLGDQTGKDVPLKMVESICIQTSAAGLIQFYRTKDGAEILQILRWQERPRAHSSRFEAFGEGCEQMFAECEQMFASLVPRSSPSFIVPRSSAIAATQAVAWSPQTGWQGIDEQIKTDFAEAYPACDFTRQLKQTDLWLRANPRKAKKSDWRKFLTNWFKREQDRGGDLRGHHPRQTPNPTQPAKKSVPAEFTAWLKKKYPEARMVWKWWDDVPDYLRTEWRKEKGT